MSDKSGSLFTVPGIAALVPYDQHLQSVILPAIDDRIGKADKRICPAISAGRRAEVRVLGKKLRYALELGKKPASHTATG
ncbi:hypothetical protein NK983_32350, partial [Salmonella enterica subsp. enterica serovar Typhimurium]|nr:hypothetical protein [Salmonella enterica subsp. enterica serovar Typhimurium]